MRIGRLPRRTRNRYAKLSILDSLQLGEAKTELGNDTSGDAYRDHCSRFIYTAAWLKGTDHSVRIDRVLEITQLVKARHLDQIQSVLHKIQETTLEWSNGGLDEAGAKVALNTVLEIWLFSNPVLDSRSTTIANAICDLYKVKTPPDSWVPTKISSLSADFTAKSLTRKAGFYLVWTSNLAEHLTFASKDQLRIFRHATILKGYCGGVERDIFPDCFLEETYRTINLLFPVEELSTSKRVGRIQRRQHVDIEAWISTDKVMDQFEKYQISSYPYYGWRLAEVQERFDLAKPRRVKQWFYDRRQRSEWGALMVALIVFILTIFFGVISSVTGILQVWASFQALKLQPK